MRILLNITLLSMVSITGFMWSQYKLGTPPPPVERQRVVPTPVIVVPAIDPGLLERVKEHQAKLQRANEKWQHTYQRCHKAFQLAPTVENLAALDHAKAKLWRIGSCHAKLMKEYGKHLR